MAVRNPRLTSFLNFTMDRQEEIKECIRIIKDCANKQRMIVKWYCIIVIPLWIIWFTLYFTGTVITF